MHRPVSKRFPRNPYTVNNALDVWECDLLHIQSLSKFNKYRYLLKVIRCIHKISAHRPPAFQDRHGCRVGIPIDPRRSEVIAKDIHKATRLGA